MISFWFYLILLSAVVYFACKGIVASYNNWYVMLNEKRTKYKKYVFIEFIIFVIGCCTVILYLALVLWLADIAKLPIDD
jgi:hypothetical protein